MFYDYEKGVSTDENDLWSNLELKIRARDLNFTLVTFWILLAVKCPLENYSKPYGCATAIPPAWGLRKKSEKIDFGRHELNFKLLINSNIDLNHQIEIMCLFQKFSGSWKMRLIDGWLNICFMNWMILGWSWKIAKIITKTLVRSPAASCPLAPSASCESRTLVYLS